MASSGRGFFNTGEGHNNRQWIDLASPNRRTPVFKETESFTFTNTGTCNLYVRNEDSEDLSELTEQYEIKIAPGETLTFNDPDKPNDYLVPGNYVIADKSATNRFTVTYSVSISPRAVQLMTEAVESLLEDLSLNFASFDPLKVSTEVATLQVLKKFVPNLSKSIYSIIDEFDSSYQTIYVKKPFRAKQNSHSVKMNIKEQGRGEESYSVKKEFTCDTPQNRALKFVATNLNSQLNNLAVSASDKLNRIRSNGWNKREEVLRETVRLAQSAASIVRQLLLAPQLVNISNPFSSQYEAALRRDDYLFVHNFSRSLDDPDLSNSGGFKQRKTWQIFELYGLVLVDDALKRAGFTLDRQSSQNIDDYELGKYAARYTRFDRIAIVRYDHNVPHFQEASKLNHQSLCYFANGCQHNKPDITIELFDERMNFITAHIIDMKYRQLNSMVPRISLLGEGREIPLYLNPEDLSSSAQFGTKRIDMIRDDITDMASNYMTFGFMDADHHLHPGAISTLTLIYPGPHNNLVHTAYSGALRFLGVDPASRDSIDLNLFDIKKDS